MRSSPRQRDEVRRDWRRVTLSGLLILLALDIGFSVGLLVGNTSEPDWVEATGTWAGVGVSGMAIFWAVRVFRSEDFMRRMEQARSIQAKEEAKAMQEGAARRVRRRQEVDAASVRFNPGHGGGYGNTNGMLKTPKMALLIVNGCITEGIGQVMFRHEAHIPEFREVAALIAPGETWQSFIEDIEEFEAPMDRQVASETLVAGSELQFTMHGVVWTKRGREDPVRVRDLVPVEES